jgi:hypothetical protein
MPLHSNVKHEDPVIVVFGRPLLFFYHIVSLPVLLHNASSWRCLHNVQEAG